MESECVASPVCEARRFFGRPRFIFWHPYAYQPAPLRPSDDVDWWAKTAPHPTNHLRFVESDDRAVRYVAHFLHSDAAWFHVIVRAILLDAFFIALEAYIDPQQPNAFLLEHSCWCDGGPDSLDPLLRHHRHMIVVARHGDHFLQRCWHAVQEPDALGVPFKVYRKINNWQHLQNTLWYVSTRKAACNLSHGAHARTDLSHYYVFQPVTAHFKLCVALTVRGGMNDFLSTTLRHDRVRPFARHCVRRGESGAFAVPVSEVMEPDWMQRTVVPVRKDFVPTGVVSGTPSEAYLILPDDRYMHFERSEAAARLEDSAWVRLQRERGNAFLEAVKDAWWSPPAHLQRVLEEVVPEWREGVETLQRRTEEYTALLAGQQTFFWNLLDETKGRHRTLMEHQKTWYQLRYKLKKAYLEKMIDWCDEWEREVERQRDHYRGQWEAVRATLSHPSTSKEAKLQRLRDIVSADEEVVERGRREKVEDERYRTRLRWEEYTRQWEAGLEYLHALLRQQPSEEIV